MLSIVSISGFCRIFAFPFAPAFLVPDKYRNPLAPAYWLILSAHRSAFLAGEMCTFSIVSGDMIVLSESVIPLSTIYLNSSFKIVPSDINFSVIFAPKMQRIKVSSS
ncbi:hypothetical protein DSECCO2_593110 [anaerobic digester metagenome]